MLGRYLSAKKTELNLTNQEISNLSGIPKSTVDRILRSEEGVSTNLETAVALVKAVGGSLDEAMGIEPSKPALPAAAPESCTENLTLLRDMLNLWWTSFSSISRAKDSAYQGSIRARDRWLVFSVLVNCVFIAWLIYDLLHPTRGWIQYDQAAVQLRQGMAGAWTVCSLWMSRI